jgi:hypothetical protein
MNYNGISACGSATSSSCSGIIVVGATRRSRPLPDGAVALARRRTPRGDLVGRGGERFLGARVRSLTRFLADKDESTEEHTRRVACAPSGRRGARPRAGTTPSARDRRLLHDIGKLSVPERILKKPGALDDDEFAAIKQHPGAAVKLLRELGGFGPRSTTSSTATTSGSTARAIRVGSASAT